MRLEILTKVSLTFFLIVLSFVADWKINHAVLFLLFQVGSSIIFTQDSFASFRKMYRRFLFYSASAFFLITALNGIFLTSGDIAIDIIGITFYEDGLILGATTAARLGVISFSLFLFFVTTPLKLLILFFQQIGLPGQLVFILFLTLHFIVQIPEKINQIYTAQEARGAQVRGNLLSRTKAFFNIIFPLVLSSISETLDRGAALELRGFKGVLTVNSATPFPLGTKLTAIVTLLASGALILYAVIR